MSFSKELFKAINKSLKYCFNSELAPSQSNEEKEEQFSFIDYINKHPETYSQIYQDLFVQFLLKNKRQGFFVEFGATNGVTLSNTYLLEKNYDWNGILAEPAKCWQHALSENRNCTIDHRCVWKKTGENFKFSEVEGDAELSTLHDFSHSSEKASSSKKIYDVDTISLNDLLKEHNAPRHIDYMSVDTEGSEFEILSALDFNRWDIQIITVEHNYSPNRKKIHKLLTSKGYSRKFQPMSRWDDWYVKTKS